MLDASALLALVNAEPDAEIVAALSEAEISSVNFAEVVTKLIDIGVRAAQACPERANPVPTIVVSGPAFASATPGCARRYAQQGLPLGNRTCLALAESEAARPYDRPRLVGAMQSVSRSA